MVFGIDEVGRGCWAGPLVVSAVSLAVTVDGLDDSKKLTALKRRALVKELKQSGAQILVAEVPATVVDQEGLGGAMRIACERLFSSISKQNYSKIVIDGNVNYLAHHENTEPLVRGDSLLAECMAASIVAKEHRDAYMALLDERYPEYGFASHVGYGTARHKQAIEDHGITSEHRTSFKPIQPYASNIRRTSRGDRSSLA